MFKSKSDNLKILQNFKLKKSKIPNFIDFTVKEWKFGNKTQIINFILSYLDKNLCFRSAFKLEDGINNSLAGKFDSYINIKNTKNNIIKNVNKLILQYKNFDKNNLLSSKIFVQNYVGDSILSGVITNYNIHDGSPYYVINYDNESNLTNAVTSGGKSSYRVLYVLKKSLSKVKSQRFKPLVLAVKEIENKINNIPVDIEFAVSKNKTVNILQIRHISTRSNWEKINFRKVELKVNKLEKLYSKINFKNKKFGKLGVLGLMPDWNPVEMIGNFPSKLSYSLYKELITKNSWSIARKEMGYNNVPVNLMYKLSGRPYIDTRLSFYSLLPQTLKKRITLKLVNYWCQDLIKKPYNHDKIEFEIADSCYDFNLKNKINKKYIFLTKDEKFEYLKLIKNHTVTIINNHKQNFQEYFLQLENLEKFRLRLFENLDKINNNNIPNIIKNIKMNGVIPFSKFARNAFIGKKILDNLLIKNVISKINYDKIFNSLNTVTSIYTDFEQKLKKKKISKKYFDNYFFHLRAGTYDIENKRYNPRLKKFEIKDLKKILNLNININHILPNKVISKINSFFKKNKFNISAKDYLEYVILSMRLRENSKFIFTRTLSDLLEIIKIFGKKFNMDKNSLSNITINQLLRMNKKTNIKLLDNNKIVQLPYLITKKDDLHVCSIQQIKPNFITNKRINSKIIELQRNSNFKKKIDKKIVLIENADPGYDWIFASKIKGLITKNGGVNSHMAIRCQELNLPAAIGVGENNYEIILKSNKLSLNCKLNKIDIIR